MTGVGEDPDVFETYQGLEDLAKGGRGRRCFQAVGSHHKPEAPFVHFWGTTQDRAPPLRSEEPAFFGGGGTVSYRAARSSGAAKLLVVALCICNRLGAALLNAGRRRKGPQKYGFGHRSSDLRVHDPMQCNHGLTPWYELHALSGTTSNRRRHQAIHCPGNIRTEVPLRPLTRHRGSLSSAAVSLSARGLAIGDAEQG